MSLSVQAREVSIISIGVTVGAGGGDLRIGVKNIGVGRFAFGVGASTTGIRIGIGGGDLRLVSKSISVKDINWCRSRCSQHSNSNSNSKQ